MNESNHEEGLAILREISARQEEMLSIQREQYTLVKEQFERAERIQDKAEKLQDNAHATFKFIVPFVIVCIVILLGIVFFL